MLHYVHSCFNVEDRKHTRSTYHFTIDCLMEEVMGPVDGCPWKSETKKKKKKTTSLRSKCVVFVDTGC